MSRRRALAFATALIVLLGAGTTAAYAAWTAVTSKSAAVTGATVGLSQTGLSTLATTYKPGLVSSGANVATIAAVNLVHNSTVAVTNTGTAPLGLALSASGGNATLNAQISVLVWKLSGTCATPAGNATTGTLAALPAIPSDANSAAAGAVVTLCVRTSMSATGYSAYTPLTTTPTITITGTVGTNWTASTAASFTQNTVFNWFQIPRTVGTSRCFGGLLDGLLAGVAMVQSTCKALVSTNAHAYRFELVAGTTDYYRVYVGNGNASGPVWQQNCVLGCGNLTLDTYEAGSTTTKALGQQWKIEQVGTSGSFRIINRNTGNCLTLVNTLDLQAVTITACTTATSGSVYDSQRFSFTAIP